jgi:hypothetical protein
VLVSLDPKRWSCWEKVDLRWRLADEKPLLNCVRDVEKIIVFFCLKMLCFRHFLHNPQPNFLSTSRQCRLNFIFSQRLYLGGPKVPTLNPILTFPTVKICPESSVKYSWSRIPQVIYYFCFHYKLLWPDFSKGLWFIICSVFLTVRG